MDCSDFFVSLAFVDKTSIQALNLKHRQKDTPTDVLSFPQLSAEEISNLDKFKNNLADMSLAVLGDVVICPEIAVENAQEDGKQIAAEIDFLIVHSLLHLLGYDHQSDDEAKVMQHMERKLLEKLC